MKTIVKYYDSNEMNEETRSGISDNEDMALQYIESSANEPIPLNQLALRSYYRSKINSLMGAEYHINQEIKKLFRESYYKGVYDARDSEFVESLYGYLQNQNGGTRRRNVKYNKNRRRTIKK